MVIIMVIYGNHGLIFYVFFPQPYLDSWPLAWSITQTVNTFAQANGFGWALWVIDLNSDPQGPSRSCRSKFPSVRVIASPWIEVRYFC